MVVLFTAMAPSYANIPDHIGVAEQGISTGGMIGFVVYFLLQIPFLCIPYHKVQYFFGFKSIIAPIIFLAVFGSTLHKAGGTISHSTVISPLPGTIKTGSALAWAFFGSTFNCCGILSCPTEADQCGIDLNGVLGNYATLGLNIADFARYSKTPNSQYVQVVVIPVIFSEYSFKVNID